LPAIFVSLVFFAAAQTLTLEDVRSLALANSRTLAKYNLTLQSNLLEERAAFYNYLPSPSLGVSAGLTLWNTGAGEQKIIDTFKAGASLGVSQTLYDGGKNRILSAINSITTDITRKNALAAYYEVLAAADKAYYELLQAAASLESAESALRTAELSLSIAEVRSATGMMNPGDYLQALAEKESKENTRNQAARTLLLKGVAIKNITGLTDVPEPEAVDFDRWEPLLAALAVMTEEQIGRLYTDLLSAAAVGNPALANAALASLKAEHNVTQAVQAYYPTLSMSVSTGLDYSAANGFKLSSGSLSLSGRIPLEVWVTANSVEKSRIARDAAALDYAGAEETLATELQTALLDLIAQAGSVLSTRRAFEYTEKRFEYAMELFRLSQNSVSALSDASAQMSSNHNQLIGAQYGFLLSLSKIRSLGAFEDEAALSALLLSSGIR
jgi:outer membrane protein TolC